MDTNDLKNITVERAADSTVKITGELPFSVLEAERAGALQELGKGVEIDGFRKGNVPEKVLIERIGEGQLLSEMARRALATAYPRIVSEQKLDVIGYPDVQITKLAPDNPLGFTITAAVMPEVQLPDYQALAKEVNASRESDAVTDEEVEKQVEEILRQKAAYDRLQADAQKNAEKAQKDTGDDVAELPTPETVEKDESKEEKPIENPEDIPLPELTDEFVKTLGQPGQFADVADFKAKVREHLELQKKQDNASKHRAKITDAIVEKAEIALPQVLIDTELRQMFAQMEEDLKRANLKMEDYLSHIKKSREELADEWKPMAEKRAKLQLVLNAIAEKDGVEPEPAKVEEEVKHLLEHHPDADESRVRTYVASMLKNDAVMQKLEALS